MKKAKVYKLSTLNTLSRYEAGILGKLAEKTAKEETEVYTKAYHYGAVATVMTGVAAVIGWLMLDSVAAIIIGKVLLVTALCGGLMALTAFAVTIAHGIKENRCREYAAIADLYSRGLLEKEDLTTNDIEALFDLAEQREQEIIDDIRNGII